MTSGVPAVGDPAADVPDPGPAEGDTADPCCCYSSADLRGSVPGPDPGFGERDKAARLSR